MHAAARFLDLRLRERPSAGSRTRSSCSPVSGWFCVPVRARSAQQFSAYSGQQKLSSSVAVAPPAPPPNVSPSSSGRSRRVSAACVPGVTCAPVVGGRGSAAPASGRGAAVGLRRRLRRHRDRVAVFGGVAGRMRRRPLRRREPLPRSAARRPDVHARRLLAALPPSAIVIGIDVRLRARRTSHAAPRTAPPRQPTWTPSDIHIIRPSGVRQRACRADRSRLRPQLLSSYLRPVAGCVCMPMFFTPPAFS